MHDLSRLSFINVTMPKALIRTGKREDGEGISGLEGIARVRALLREPRKIVRLVRALGCR